MATNCCFWQPCCTVPTGKETITAEATQQQPQQGAAGATFHGTYRAESPLKVPGLAVKDLDKIIEDAC